MSAKSDINKAKDLRNVAKSIKDPDAKQAFQDAADRLELRAAKSVRKVGRRSRRRNSGGSGSMVQR